MNTKNFRWMFHAMLALSLLACHDKDQEKDPLARRTIIAYLAGDNSLSSYMNRNIEDMIAGMKQRDCHLLVYFDGASAAPELYEIVATGKNKAEKQTIASYPEENTSDPATLQRVIQDAMALRPAHSYGLILGSHATGWMPANAKITRGTALSECLEEAGEPRPLTRTFGEDKSSASDQMDVLDMADAIPEGIEFIVFDACMMSSIEVLYELRHKTNYIIATPTEIDAAGFTYASLLPYFWGGVDDLKKACELYYDARDQKSGNKFASITLVSTAALDDLYAVVREVFQGKLSEVAAISPATIYRYPRINIPSDAYFDLREFVEHVATPAQFQQFEIQLQRVVLYKEITDPFYSTPVPDKTRACGISSYIPLAAWATWDTEYSRLPWAGIYQ